MCAQSILDPDPTISNARFYISAVFSQRSLVPMHASKQLSVHVALTFVHMLCVHACMQAAFQLAVLQGCLPAANLEEVVTLLSGAPQLLLRPAADIAQGVAELGAALKVRGLSLMALALQRPDLLLQRTVVVAAALDALPSALGLPPRRARMVIEGCPDLLRRCVPNRTLCWCALHP